MNEPKEKLNADYKKRIKAELQDQAQLTFKRLEDTANKYTQHLFIVNAGGAAAVLAFLGAKEGTSIMILPLALFVCGVIACGIKLYASFRVDNKIFNDILNIKIKFRKEGVLKEDMYPNEEKRKNYIWYKIAIYTSYIAHGAFIGGVIIGMIVSIISLLVIPLLNKTI